MSKPWIQETILKLLDRPGEKAVGERGFTFLAKTVQVTSCSLPTQSIVVSDMEHSICVFLTKKCIAGLAQQQQSLPDLKYCCITLKQYHVSTTVTAGAAQADFKAVTTLCSVPFVLICDRMSYLGGFDLAIMGDPSDINKIERVRKQLENLQYHELARCLAHKQFPGHNTLPDIGMSVSNARRVYDRQFP